MRIASSITLKYCSSVTPSTASRIHELNPEDAPESYSNLQTRVTNDAMSKNVHNIEQESSDL